MVRYTGQYRSFFMSRILPLFVLFALLALLYLDDESRGMIFSRKSATFRPFSWFEFGLLLCLVTAPLLDLALTLRRVQRGAIALCISPQGITGTVFHTTRMLPWSEIAEVALNKKFLVVRRQRQTLIRKLFASRGIGDINVPEHQVDRNGVEILAAVRQCAPAHLYRGVAQ